MALIRPFRGFRYRSDKTDISTYCAPPYDVLNTSERDALAAKNPYNAVELELGHGALDLDTPDNRYVTTAARWRQWIADGILEQDDSPSIYVLEQRFDVDGKTYARTAFIAEIQIRAFADKVILPHERTLPKALGDRYRLTKTTRANFSSVFGLYSDKSSDYVTFCNRVKSSEPMSTATDADGVASSLWVISDPAIIADFIEMTADKQVFIADGHHRYTIALKIRDEERERRYGLDPEIAVNSPEFDADAGSEFVMMALANMDDPQLLVLPYHRAIKAKAGFSSEDFLRKLAESFKITNGGPDDLAACSRPAFLFKMADENMLLAELKSDIDPDLAIKAKHGDDWKHLDVSVLQELVIAPLFSINYNEPETLTRLAFSKDENELLDGVADGTLDVAFIMRAVRMNQLRSVSLAGETMPQKSTYFYPKLPSGFVYRTFEE